MGTPTFAVTILASLAKRHHVVAVYSQPPRKAGRGHHVVKSPVHMYAEGLGLPVFTPTSFKDPDEQARFQDLDCDVAVVAAYGLLLPRAILGAPRMGCVNVHGSLLPRWRGAAPVQYALMEGDTETGVCLMQMEAGMDTGPVFARAALRLTPTSTTTQVLDQLAHLGARLWEDYLEAYVDGAVVPIPQPSEGVTYCPKIPKELGLADFSLSAAALERRLRALGGIWFDHEGGRLKVLEAAAVEGSTGFPIGTICDETLGIQCAAGLFRPLIVQKEGGKAQDVASFLRGNPVPKGTRLAV